VARRRRRALPRPDQVRVERLRVALLEWALSNGRSYKWREPSPIPYSILVTEILLAKTQADAVAPVVARVLRRYGNVTTLAKARVRDLEQLLYPLGLQRKRARNLKACANVVVRHHDGTVPRSIEDLMDLPFVGRYAANAIASVAFDEPVAVVDANVVRVYRRVFSLRATPKRISTADEWWKFASAVLPVTQAKEFNWALLDLGGTVCVARNPLCSGCPLREVCDHAASTAAKAAAHSALAVSTGASPPVDLSS
jgi:A/G-specific adenine glycosylase